MVVEPVVVELVMEPGIELVELVELVVPDSGRPVSGRLPDVGPLVCWDMCPPFVGVAFAAPEKLDSPPF